MVCRISKEATLYSVDHLSLVRASSFPVAIEKGSKKENCPEEDSVLRSGRKKRLLLAKLTVFVCFGLYSLHPCLCQTKVWPQIDSVIGLSQAWLRFYLP